MICIFVRSFFFEKLKNTAISNYYSIQLFVFSDYKYNAKSLKKYVGDEASEAVITIHLYYNGFLLHLRPNVYGNNLIKFRTVIKKDGRKSLNMSANECKCIPNSQNFFLNYGCRNY